MRLGPGRITGVPSPTPLNVVYPLRAMRRVGRPPIGEAPRQLIAIRVDTGVLEQFRKAARRSARARPNPIAMRMTAFP